MIADTPLSSCPGLCDGRPVEKAALVEKTPEASSLPPSRHQSGLGIAQVGAIFFVMLGLGPSIHVLRPLMRGNANKTWSDAVLDGKQTRGWSAFADHDARESEACSAQQGSSFAEARAVRGPSRTIRHYRLRRMSRTPRPSRRRRSARRVTPSA